jgi:hypothetical protein
VAIMEYNYFKCYKCKKVTKHVRISLKEESDINDPTPSSFLEKVFRYGILGIGVISGYDKFLGDITGIKAWKCTECANCDQRKSDGSYY